MFKYIGLFVATCGFEFAYIRWIAATTQSGPAVVAHWGTLVSTLSVLGIGGALGLPYGWIPYLAGVWVGGFVTTYLARRRSGSSRS